MHELTVSAPGKIILFGEHAVVYGEPAIAAPLSALRTQATVSAAQPGQGVLVVAANLGRTIVIRQEPQAREHPLAVGVRLLMDHLNRELPDLQVLLHSTIPMASGLGSGAAATTALLRALTEALGQPLDVETLNGLVYEIEKLYHGTPSGIDNTVVVYERPVYFVRGKPIETFRIGTPLHFVVGDTGIASPTHQAVGDVRRLTEADPERMKPLFTRVGAISDAAREAIRVGNVAALGPLMQENHALLVEMTVSSPELDRLVAAAEAAGAYGAKVSGGGRGGNMIALAAPDKVKAVTEALLEAGARDTIETVLQEEQTQVC